MIEDQQWLSFPNRCHLVATRLDDAGSLWLLHRCGHGRQPDRWLTLCGNGPEIGSKPTGMCSTSPPECRLCFQAWTTALTAMPDAEVRR